MALHYIPTVRKIDFGKCKDFDQLCGLLNMLDINFTYNPDDPDDVAKLAAFEPYFADGDT